MKDKMDLERILKKVRSDENATEVANKLLVNAVQERNAAIVKMICLLEIADVTANNNYVIRLAAYNGDDEIVEILLEAGADITADNDYVLRAAADRGFYKIVKLAIENGADVTADDNYSICRATEQGHKEIVDLLKRMGATANVGILVIRIKPKKRKLRFRRKKAAHKHSNC